MTEAVAISSSSQVVVSSAGWRELWLKEDWWAIWLGLGLVIAATVAFANGSSLAWIAVTPAKWSTFDQLASHFAGNLGRYGAQFVLWLVLFTGATSVLGWKARAFVPAFILLYLLSLAIFALGAWDQAQK